MNLFSISGQIYLFSICVSAENFKNCNLCPIFLLQWNQFNFTDIFLWNPIKFNVHISFKDQHVENKCVFFLSCMPINRRKISANLMIFFIVGLSFLSTYVGTFSGCMVVSEKVCCPLFLRKRGRNLKFEKGSMAEFIFNYRRCK